MVVVILKINGKTLFKECENEEGVEKEKEEAKEQVTQWLKEAEGSFPNGVFTPTYYTVLKKE